MKRSPKSNRVSCFPNVKLCQARPFLSEDCPSKVCSQVEDHRKVTSWNSQHPYCLDFNDIPPGFEGRYYLKSLKDGLSFIPTIEWKCPPKFGISHKWLVASGEESLEAQAQKIRETRVLEAVYPLFSGIPTSPCVSSDNEDNHYDDSLTPIIHLTPIEEREVPGTPSDLPAPLKISISSHPTILPQVSQLSGTLNPLKCSPHILEPSAIKMSPNVGFELLTAVADSHGKSKEEAGLIDIVLLAKILNNPEMVEELTCNGYQAAAAPISTLKTSKPVARSTPPVCPSLQMPLAPMPANADMHHRPGEVLPTVTRVSAHAAIGSGLHVAPSFSMSMPEPIKASIPGLAPGKLNSKPNLEQPSLNTVLMQPDTAVNSSFMTVKPNPVPILQPPNSGITAPHSNILSRTSAPAIQTNPGKDAYYIKNLIKEHGTEKKEMQNRSVPGNGSNYNHLQSMEMSKLVKVRKVNAKFQKPCMYFKSSRGCRNGSKCPYGHDSSSPSQNSNAPDTPDAKRMKLRGAINGR